MMVDELKKKAGLARTDAMSGAERKALATRAAHARWKKDPDGVAVATHVGELQLGSLTLPCAVLKDGRRIFSERGLSDAFTHVRSGGEYKKRRGRADGETLPVFINDTLANYLSEDARKLLESPVRYRQAGGLGIPARGVDAKLLPEICDAYLAARADGALDGVAAQRKAAVAERLMRSLAKVAVVALIDEATGYQVERDKDELQRLLEKYVAEEFRPYARMFPTEFYTQMFRLRKVTTDDVRKRPAYFGTLTNDIIYDRLLPGTIERLDTVNPVSGSGRRSRKHHQHFTDGPGANHLREHLAGTIFLMKSATSWGQFMRRLDKAAPRVGSQLELSGTDESE